MLSRNVNLFTIGQLQENLLHMDQYAIWINIQFFKYGIKNYAQVYQPVLLCTCTGICLLYASRHSIELKIVQL